MKTTRKKLIKHLKVLIENDLASKINSNLKNEQSFVGDVFQGNPLERRFGRKKLSASIRDESVIDLFEKIMKGGFEVSNAKASKDEVMAYQKFLSSLNYDIDIDGDYGEKTKEITKELQADLFAKESGIFGKETLNELIEQLKESNIEPDRASFNTVYPDSTTGIEIIKWLTSQFVLSDKNLSKVDQKSLIALPDDKRYLYAESGGLFFYVEYVNFKSSGNNKWEKIKSNSAIDKIQNEGVPISPSKADLNKSISATLPSKGRRGSKSIDDMQIKVDNEELKKFKLKGYYAKPGRQKTFNQLFLSFWDEGITNPFFYLGLAGVMAKESGIIYNKIEKPYLKQTLESVKKIFMYQSKKTKEWKLSPRLRGVTEEQWILLRDSSVAACFNYLYGGELPENLISDWPPKALAAAKKKAKTLGNTQPGDGHFYRGGGLIQNTGRENWKKRGLNPTTINNRSAVISATVGFLMKFMFKRNVKSIEEINNITSLSKGIAVVADAVAGGKYTEKGRRLAKEKLGLPCITYDGNMPGDVSLSIGENKKIFKAFLKILNEKNEKKAMSQEEADKFNILNPSNEEYWELDDVMTKTTGYIDKRLLQIEPDYYNTKAGRKNEGDDFPINLYNTLLDIVKTGKYFKKTKNRYANEVFFIQLGLAGLTSDFKNALVSADGDYGNNTKKVVAQFQKEAGIKTDGSFGKESALAMLLCYKRGGYGTTVLGQVKKDILKIANTYKASFEKLTQAVSAASKTKTGTADSGDSVGSGISNIIGEKFTYNGIRYQSAPYKKAAQEAIRLKKSAESDPGTGYNKRNFDHTLDGKRWLLANIFAGLPGKFKVAAESTPEYIARMEEGKDTRAHWSSYWTNVCTYDDSRYAALDPYVGYINEQSYKNFKSSQRGGQKGIVTWVAFPEDACPLSLGDQLLATFKGDFEDIKTSYRTQGKHGRIVVNISGNSATVIGGNEAGRVGTADVSLDDKGALKPGQKYGVKSYAAVLKRVKVIGPVGNMSENKYLTKALKKMLFESKFIK